jgi:predicted outer membrane repeat protein
MSDAGMQQTRFSRLGTALMLGLALVFSLVIASAAHAATFTVTNTDDLGPGSLRQAVEDANTAAGTDVINFQIATLPDAIVLISGELLVTDSVDIQGPGAANLVVTGNTSSRVFHLENGAAVIDVTISGLNLSSGSATQGAGIFDAGENLVLDSVLLTGNAATSDGGGLWASGSANLTIRNSRFSGNTADRDGGAVYVENLVGPMLVEDTAIAGNLAGRNGGGALFLTPDGAVTFDRSTISGNFTTLAGGGLYLDGTGGNGTAGGAFVIRSSTLSGNNAVDGAGAYFNLPAGPVSFEHSTVAGNTATGTGGGIYSAAATVTLDQTIVGDNTAATDNDLANDSDGSFDVRYSLIESPGAATINDNGGNVLNQDPQLGPLSDNGGSTETHAPAGTSPAVNAGDPAFVPPPATDQRGFPRVVNGRIDIGSVELGAGTLQFSSPTYMVNENGVTATITVTRTNGSASAVSVNYQTSNGTATQPADYLTAAGTLNWADGDDAPKTFQVTIADDGLVEGSETVNLTLSAPQGATLGSPSTAVLTIVDNDQVAVNAPGIPTLGDVGKVLFAGFCGLAALLLLRRRRLGNGPITNW